MVNPEHWWAWCVDSSQAEPDSAELFWIKGVTGSCGFNLPPLRWRVWGGMRAAVGGQWSCLYPLLAFMLCSSIGNDLSVLIIHVPSGSTRWIIPVNRGSCGGDHVSFYRLSICDTAANAHPLAFANQTVGWMCSLYKSDINGTKTDWEWFVCQNN